MATQQAHGGRNKSMYTSIRRYNVAPNSPDSPSSPSSSSSPDSVNEIIRRAEKGFVPIISQARGFVAYDMVDTGNATLTTISTFENAEWAEQSNRLAADWVKENVATLLPEPPMIASGTVGLHKTI